MADSVAFQRLRDLAEVVARIRRRVEAVEAASNSPLPPVVGTVGNNVDDEFVIAHPFGSRAVTVECWRNAAPYESVIPDISRSTGAVTLGFGAPPTSNQFAYAIKP